MSDNHCTNDKRCIVCDSDNISLFIEISQLPVHCNQLFLSYELAVNAQRADIDLAYCKNCSHVFNLAFDPKLMKYDQDYENSLHFSSRYQLYAEKLAKHLIDTYDLHNKTIIEIGCGKGDFLKLLCHLGPNYGIGFDPSYDNIRNNEKKYENITFIKDFYSPAYSHLKADFICCRQVLEHLQYPRQLLDCLHQAINTQNNATVFFEVPNGNYSFKDLGIWDLIYEHRSYFCHRSLEYIFSACGFDIYNCFETFDGQFLNIEVIPKSDLNSSNKQTAFQKQSIDRYIETFAQKHNNTVEKWRNDLQQLNQKKIVVWGAGSKGVTFLNILDTANQIDFAIDINPHKQDKFIPATAQKVVSPDFLKKYNPNTVVVMNPIYMKEIQQFIHQLNLKPQVFCA